MIRSEKKTDFKIRFLVDLTTKDFVRKYHTQVSLPLLLTV